MAMFMLHKVSNEITYLAKAVHPSERCRNRGMAGRIPKDLKKNMHYISKDMDYGNILIVQKYHMILNTKLAG